MTASDVPIVSHRYTTTEKFEIRRFERVIEVSKHRGTPHVVTMRIEPASPLYNAFGQLLPGPAFEATDEELVAMFGGVTRFDRKIAPVPVPELNLRP